MWKLSDLVVWVLGIFRLLIDHDLSIVTSNYETLLIGNDTLDVKVVSWGFIKAHFELTTLKKHDLSLVSTNEESTIWQPCVTCVVVRDMRVLLQDLGVNRLQTVVILNSVVLVHTITSDQDDVLVLVVEGALGHTHVTIHT